MGLCPSSVRRPPVLVAIISVLNARLSFKFQLLRPLGHMLVRFLPFEKKSTFSISFYDFQLCFVLLHIRATIVTRASVVRPSVVRPSVKLVFPETVQQINATFGGKVPFHLCPDHFLLLLLFLKISHFLFFYDFFFSFSLTWDHMGEQTSNDISPMKLHNRFTQKKCMHTSREGLYRSCIKIGNISIFGFWPIFFFVFMGPYGSKETTSCLKYTKQIYSQKFMHTPRKGLHLCFIKNCEIKTF